MAGLVTEIDAAALATTYSSSEEEEENSKQECPVAAPNEHVLTVDIHDKNPDSCTLDTSVKKRKHDQMDIKNRYDKKHIKKSSRGQKNNFSEVVDVCSGNSSVDSLSSEESEHDLYVEDDLETREWRRKREDRRKNLIISPKADASEDSLSDDDVEVELQVSPVQALHSAQRQGQVATEDDIFAASAIEDAQKAAEEVKVTVAFSKRKEVRVFGLHGNAKFQELNDMIVSSLHCKPEDFALHFEGEMVSLDRTIEEFMSDEDIDEREFQLDA